MKIQKSLCLHVWWLRMRSKYGMVTKLFSAQRYDPRQVSQNLVRCAEPHKKFSRHPQSHTVECVKHNFWDTSETLLQNGVARGYENSKIAMFYAPDCVTLSGARKILWDSAHQTKLLNTCLGSYLCAEKSIVTIPYLERILSDQTCKHSDFWIFIPPGNPILKFEKAPKCVKNDGIEVKFSIEMPLKIFLCIQYHQYGYM